jgi:hypothetical protein
VIGDPTILVSQTALPPRRDFHGPVTVGIDRADGRILDYWRLSDLLLGPRRTVSSSGTDTCATIVKGPGPEGPCGSEVTRLTSIAKNQLCVSIKVPQNGNSTISYVQRVT